MTGDGVKPLVAGVAATRPTIFENQQPRLESATIGDGLSGSRSRKRYGIEMVIASRYRWRRQVRGAERQRSTGV